MMSLQREATPGAEHLAQLSPLLIESEKIYTKSSCHSTTTFNKGRHFKNGTMLIKALFLVAIYLHFRFQENM